MKHNLYAGGVDSRWHGLPGGCPDCGPGPGWSYGPLGGHDSGAGPGAGDLGGSVSQCRRHVGRHDCHSRAERQSAPAVGHHGQTERRRLRDEGRARGPAVCRHRLEGRQVHRRRLQSRRSHSAVRARLEGRSQAAGSREEHVHRQGPRRDVGRSAERRGHRVAPDSETLERGERRDGHPGQRRSGGRRDRDSSIGKPPRTFSSTSVRLAPPSRATSRTARSPARGARGR